MLSLQRKGEESTKSPTDSSTEDVSDKVNSSIFFIVLLSEQSNQAAVLEMCQQLDLFKACEVVGFGLSDVLYIVITKIIIVSEY